MNERHEQIHLGRKQIFLNNLLGGIAWGIGATIGLSLLVAFLGLAAHYINLVPLFGNFVSDILNFVISKNPYLISTLMPFLFSQYAFA